MPGGYAEYTLVPHASVSAPIKLPEKIGWADFAAIPETYFTGEPLPASSCDHIDVAYDSVGHAERVAQTPEH